jgi:hypothetical protein
LGTVSDSDPPPTCRLCPACGYTAEGGRSICRLCGGTGLATPEQIVAWRTRQRTGLTSSATKSIPFQAEEALRGLRDRRTWPAETLARVGEGILERLRRDPLDEDALTKMSEWLTAVQGLLRGDR